MTNHKINLWQIERRYDLLPVQQLHRGRYQPRMHFCPIALEELAQSIAEQGLIEPIIVRSIALDRYEIIAGERRWLACQQLGMEKIPCLIGEYSDEQAAALTLVENIQREGLNLIEEATGYRRLRDEFSFNQEEIATLVGKSRSHIANLLRLLTLCPVVQKNIQTGNLSLGHARLLVGLPIPQQEFLAQQIQQQDWSVRQTELYIRQLKKSATQEAFVVQRDVEKLETMLSEQVGSPVKISSESNQGGWLKVKFYDNDTLAGILERLGLRYD